MDDKKNITAVEENITFFIDDAKDKFAHLQAVDMAYLSKWFATAKAASDDIRESLKYVKRDLSELDTTGKKSAAEMEKELVDATVKLQVSEVRKSFEKLKIGDITISPTYMADNIRGDLKAVNRSLAVLDVSHKKTADEMEKELTKITDEQQFKISSSVAKFEKAKALFEQLEKRDEKVPYVNPKTIRDRIESLVEESGNQLYTLSGGEQTNFQVSERLRIAVEQEQERSELASKAISDAKKNGETVVAYIKDREVRPVVINRR